MYTNIVLNSVQKYVFMLYAWTCQLLILDSFWNFSTRTRTHKINVHTVSGKVDSRMGEQWLNSFHIPGACDRLLKFFLLDLSTFSFCALPGYHVILDNTLLLCYQCEASWVQEWNTHIISCNKFRFLEILNILPC